MKYYKLDKEEKELLRTLSASGVKRVKNAGAEKRRYEEYARATLQKTRNINIRLSEKDVHKLKERALERGIPYQTLAASVLHQFTHGRIKEFA